MQNRSISCSSLLIAAHFRAFSNMYSSAACSLDIIANFTVNIYFLQTSESCLLRVPKPGNHLEQLFEREINVVKKIWPLKREQLRS